MAQTKATSDALMAMSEQLRQSAEQIQAAKASMNNQLHSFSWDDPVGIAFINDYHEKMKPIDNKLLPAIQNYLEYIGKLEGGLEEYDERAGMGIIPAAAIGVTIAATSVAFLRATDPNRQPHKHKPIEVIPKKFTKVDYDPKKDFEELMKDDKYKTQYGIQKQRYYRIIKNVKDVGYEERKAKVIEQLKKDRKISRLNDLEIEVLNNEINKPTLKEIDRINSIEYGFKEPELEFSYKDFKNPIQGGVAVDKYPKTEIGIRQSRYVTDPCGEGAMGAHESRHAEQYRVIAEGKKKGYLELNKREVTLLKSHYNPARPPIGTKEYMDDPVEQEARVSQYAFRDACMKYNNEKLSIFKSEIDTLKRSIKSKH